MIDIQSDAFEKIAKFVVEDYERLSQKRSGFESMWRQISERVFPNGSRNFNPSSYYPGQGESRTSEIFDPTASIALNRFASILDSLLTPRNQTWHRIGTNNAYLAKNRQAKLYFDEVNAALFKYRYAAKANYSSQNQKVWKNLGGFGTGSLFIDELYGEPGIRYKAMHLGQIYFDENHQGMIDKAIRAFPLKYRQLVRMFGEEKLPKQIVDENKVANDKFYTVLHWVGPRDEDYDPSRFDAKGMPIAGYYVIKDVKWTIAEGGFNTFPYATSRFEQADDEIYGRSPAMEVLPAIKTLNEQKRVMLTQGHRALAPVFLTHDDGVVVDFTPGASNSGGINANGQRMIDILPAGNIQIGKDMMEMERAHINDAFYVTLFQILMETPNMTATEVVERTKEKGILLAPTLGRQQTEYLEPKIAREIDLLARQGLLPPKPGILREAGSEYQVTYVSELNRTQQAGEASGFMRALQTTLEVAQITQDPSILHIYDLKTAMPEIAEILGAPARWMNDPKVVAAMDAQVAQQRAAEMQIDALPAQASVLKTMQGARK